MIAQSIWSHNAPFLAHRDEVEGSLCYTPCINSRIVDIYQLMVMVAHFISIKVGKGETLFLF